LDCSFVKCVSGLIDWRTRLRLNDCSRLDARNQNIDAVEVTASPAFEDEVSELIV
jgi:hypothetical protein